MMDPAVRTKRARLLSSWLRHRPESVGLALDDAGWASIDDALAAYTAIGHPISRAEFDEVVRLDDRTKFEVQADRVRARYGHSTVILSDMHPDTPPAVLYHEVPARHADNVIRGGLKPIKRSHVHLAATMRAALGEGEKRKPTVVVRISAHAAHAAGVRFYPRGKGVWVSDAIPAEFVTLEPDQDTFDQPPARPVRSAGSRRRRPAGGFMKPGEL